MEGRLFIMIERMLTVYGMPSDAFFRTSTPTNYVSVCSHAVPTIFGLLESDIFSATPKPHPVTASGAE